jgi:hypothetical protein
MVAPSIISILLTSFMMLEYPVLTKKKESKSCKNGLRNMPHNISYRLLQLNLQFCN